MGKIEVINHPLIQHKLSILRRTDTSTKAFRELVDEIAMLMGYEVLRDLPLEDVEIETPITKTVQKQLAGKKLAIVPILRAGIGMVDGLLSLVPAAKSVQNKIEKKNDLEKYFQSRKEVGFLFLSNESRAKI